MRGSKVKWLRKGRSKFFAEDRAAGGQNAESALIYVYQLTVTVTESVEGPGHLRTASNRRFGEFKESGRQGVLPGAALGR